MSKPVPQFGSVPRADIPRSTFDRSHCHKTDLSTTFLYPIFVDEVLPGDTFNVRAHFFSRFTTALVPLMDNLWLDTFWFFIPNRLVWDNWARFMGEKTSPSDTTEFTVPQCVTSWNYYPGPPSTAQIGSALLYNRLGVPADLVDSSSAKTITVNNLFARAYNLVWNEWFRDQNLQDPVPVPKDDGPDTMTDFILLPRGKRHDYFTSCLPWPQKGPGVDIPVVGMPVNAIGKGTSDAVAPTFLANNTSDYSTLRYAASATPQTVSVNYGSTAGGSLYWNTTGLEIGTPDPGSPAGTINALREAFALQRLLERDARGGTRYIELLRSHFGVVSPDFRLQRPEYLGGGTVPVTFVPVPQSSATGTYAQTPQANLAAYATAAGGASGFVRSFTEHGILLGLVNVRPELIYQQGLNRMFTRQTRYDYYWPAMANLGEQAVLSKEIYCKGNEDTDDDSVFGYQERWAEYRYFPSRTSGKMASYNSTPLDIWHLAEEFSTRPLLGSQFIVSNPPIQRNMAVQTEPPFILDAYFSVKCARPMPVQSVPGLVDHF